MIALTPICWASLLFSRLILLFLLSATNYSWAVNDIALIDDTHSVYNIANSAYYLVDPNDQLTINTVASEEYAKNFLPIKGDFLQLGLIKGNIWIRADIAIRTTKNEPILLEFNAPRLEYLDIYIPSLYENQVQAQLGEARPYTNRLIEHPNYLYPLPNAAPPVFSVYIRLASHLPINAQIYLKSLSKVSIDSQKNFSLTGLLMGVMLILLLSNLFFYIKSRHPMYALYCMFLVCIAVLHLALHDQLYQFFPTQIGIQERIYNFSALACMLIITLFSRLYLDTKSYFPTLDKGLLLIAATNALLAVLFTVSPQFIEILYLSLSIFTTLFLLTALAIYAYFKAIPFSGYYLLARTALLIGYFIWFMTAYGILPSPLIYEWGLTLAFITEAMIHFTGIFTQLPPLLNNYSKLSGASQTKLLDLMSDLSSRLRRQTNVINGSLLQIDKNIRNEKNKHYVHNSLVANNNLLALTERLNYITAPPESHHIDQSLPTFLTKIVDDAYNNFQSLDQDNTMVELITTNLDHVELLNHAELLQHLIETMLCEFKYFTDQTLTLEVIRHELNREGITQLELRCYPLPNRVSTNDAMFDLGMGYITLLIQHLNGKMDELNDDQLKTLKVKIPITSHTRHANTEQDETLDFDLILFGQQDHDLQQALNILQSKPNSIEHLAQLDDLLVFLEKPESRTMGSVIVVFDNGGHIPHITLQKMQPLLRPEDQCLLITNNVKMSRDYAKTLGFDELLTCNELEQQLEQQLLRLIRKGERLTSSKLSNINSLQQDA